MDILIFILGILLFIGLVVVHEFGHAIAARRNGVEVEEFGIGFPPRAWSKKLKNGTLFSLNWLPLGGFVKLKGEHDSAKGPGTYGGASLWAKTKILLAGITVNWLTAVVIFAALALVGIPKVLPNQFNVAGDNQVTIGEVLAAGVAKGSPAEKAGLVNGDTLVRFAGQPVKDAGQFKSLAQENAGKSVELVYRHEKQERTATVTLNERNINNQGFIGVGAAERATQRATWSAPIVGVGLTIQFTYETFAGLAKTVVNLFQTKFAEAGASVAGPVGIVGILKDSATLGIVPVLFLIGVISLTLAVMNLLPIPALDGGRLFVTVLFRALKKPLTKEREENIQAVGFMVLMGLVLVITVVDVGKLFK